MIQDNLFARRGIRPRTAHTSISKRRETQLVGLEPLEDRKMLAVGTAYINDNWTNDDGPDLDFGDFVSSTGADGLIITAEYGFDAFGTVDGQSLAGAATIADAIANTTVGGTLNILAGTYSESDIVVTKGMTVRGITGATQATIVPEVLSSHATAEDFAADTHSGFIIYSASVTIDNLKIDGNGNGSLGGTLNYHHGITTLYDTQNGGNYSTVRNGSLAPSNMGGDDATTNIRIQNVTVTNTWWHGITLSGINGTNIRGNTITGATVSNVGEVGSRDLHRVGIMLQNHDGGQVLESSVSNVGVGIASGTFGTLSFGNNNNARNRTGMRLNTVTDADQRAYSVVNQDGQIDLNFLLIPGAQFIGFNANKAIYTSPSNNGVGLYLNHSQPVVIGYEATNAKIGVQIENTTVENLLLPIFAGTTITGPGMAVADSIGILADNAGDPTTTSNLGIGGTTKITGFETGIRIHQTNVIAEPNLMQIDRPILSGNAVAISVGDNSVFQGNVNTGDSVQTTGTGTLQPGFPDSFFIATGPGSPVDFAGPYSDVANTGTVNLNSTGTFDARLTGQTGSTSVFTFDEEVGSFEFGLIPPVPDGGRTDMPNGSSFLPGQVQQTGGQLTIGNGAVNGPLNVAYNTLNHPDPNEPGYFILDPMDISAYSHLDIVVKLGVGNQAKAFIFGLADTTGQIALFTFSTEGMSTSTYSTLTLNLAAPGIPFALGPDGNFDLTQVMGYAVLGDEGLINGAQNVPFALVFDQVNARGVTNSQLNVTGAVNLGSAQLAVSLGDDFTPTIGQQFTIINNDGGDAVVGTFAGAPQGSTVASNGHKYTVSYTGGTGNDVVLTYAGLDAGIEVMDRKIFYNASKFDGNSSSINASDDLAIAPDKAAFNGVGTAPLSAFTSYSRGINGIMVDIEGADGVVSLADFTFKAGANNMPSLWANAPAPSGFSIRPGAGIGGSDRVVITWANGSIVNQWLQVVVEGNDTVGGNNTNTGLATSDVFFFGNRLGDTFVGSAPTLVITNSNDQIAVRNATGPGKPITNTFDFNKDTLVSVADEIIARNNVGTLTRVINWVAPAAPVAEPALATEESSDDGGSAVASALSMRPKASAPKVPGWITSRLASVDLNSGRIAQLFTKLAEVNTPGTRSLLLAANEVTDALDLDDSLLESLIDGLN